MHTRQSIGVQSKGVYLRLSNLMDDSSCESLVPEGNCSVCGGVYNVSGHAIFCKNCKKIGTIN